MIHYHGTPITPRHKLLEMSGRHFCVSYARPEDLKTCLEIGQSVMLDNGAFSAFTRGKTLNIPKFYAWIENNLIAPHWAVIPDVIGGTEDDQRKGLREWPFPDFLSAPVWHMNLSVDYLLELADRYPKICIGSSGDFWHVGSRKWVQRMDEAFNELSKRRFLPWIHGMRMLSQSDKRWPFASADSTNVAQSHSPSRGKPKISPEVLAHRIDAVQSPKRYIPNPQVDLWT